MLTGELPFSGSAMQTLGQKSVLDPASPLHLKDVSCLPSLAAICHKMIARKNVDRYQTLAAVIDDLQKPDAIITLPLPAPLVDQPLAAFAEFALLLHTDELNARTAKNRKESSSKGRPASSRAVRGFLGDSSIGESGGCPWLGGLHWAERERCWWPSESFFFYPPSLGW